jgi:predicted metal-dependent hydrolase
VRSETQPSIDPRLDEAVGLFNSQEFFACHDVLEEIWSETIGPDRDYYQGLIHAAVALYHFSEGNLGGARKMYDSTQRYLSSCATRADGIDIERLLTDMTLCFQDLIAARQYPEGLAIRAERIPRLHRRCPAPPHSQPAG